MTTKILFAAVSAVLMLTAAAAEDKPAQAAAIAPPNIRQCLGILAGLNALDGHKVIVAKGKSSESAEFMQYKLSGKTRDSISHNIFVLNQVQAEAQAANRRAQMEIRAGADKMTEAQATELDNRLNDYLDRPCNAQLDHLKDADLFVEENELPPSVLSALWPIRDR